MTRSLCLLPGGIGRVVPCSIGADQCRFRHIDWEKSGHGLTSRPRESASERFLNEILSLFSYPPGSAQALLAGILHLPYVLLVLPVGPLLGGCQYLVMLLVWLLILLGCFLRFLHVVRGHGVLWVRGSGPGLVHVCGRDCVMWGQEEAE